MQWSLHTIVEWTLCKRTCRIIWEKLQAEYYINWTYLWQCFNKWSDDTRKNSGRKPNQSGITTTCEIKWKRNMDVYQNLTQDQALFLALSIGNELHENSQELSFSEKVMFFHKVSLDCERKFAGQTKKLISTKWRSEIAAIMNKSVSIMYIIILFSQK